MATLEDFDIDDIWDTNIEAIVGYSDVYQATHIDALNLIISEWMEFKFQKIRKHLDKQENVNDLTPRVIELERKVESLFRSSMRLSVELQHLFDESKAPDCP